MGRSEAATPELAVAKAINSMCLIVASKARYKKLLLIPLGPSIKNVPNLFENNLSRMTL